jgi:hypothetical protein
MKVRIHLNAFYKLVIFDHRSDNCRFYLVFNLIIFNGIIFKHTARA